MNKRETLPRAGDRKGPEIRARILFVGLRKYRGERGRQRLGGDRGPI